MNETKNSIIFLDKEFYRLYICRPNAIEVLDRCNGFRVFFGVIDDFEKKSQKGFAGIKKGFYICTRLSDEGLGIKE